MKNGFSFSGFLAAAAIIVAAALVAMRIVPPYMEYGKIEKDMAEIVNNPDMANASGPEIRDAFTKKASVDDIKSVGAEDLEIDRDPLRIHVKYGVKVPLVANVSLFVDFEIKAVKDSK